MDNYVTIDGLVGGVYERATMQDNLDHTGGITIEWKSCTEAEIAYGSTLEYAGLKWVLMEPYKPTPTNGYFSYSVTFRHPQVLLDKIPFWIDTMAVDGHDVRLRTTSFVGPANQIAAKIAEALSGYAQAIGNSQLLGSIIGSWQADLVENALANTYISVAFDGCSIKQAAVIVAEALGCNVFFDWSDRKIRFIGGTTVDGDIYDGIHVLGGTKNMGKAALSGGYSAVTERLTLPTGDNGYPNSIMWINAGDTGLGLVKDIVLDEIYPKMELYISSVRARTCYLTDENGDRIQAGQGELNHDGYKIYTKWYIKLSVDRAGETPYVFDETLLINDKPLSILFQPDTTENAPTCPLTGREFELAHFTTATTEWGEDDVLPQTNAFVAAAGEYRIILKTEQDYLLPGNNLGTQQNPTGMIPHVGNKVTLVNMKCDDDQIAAAKAELKAAATEICALYRSRYAEHTEQVVGEVPAVGSGGSSSPVVTSVSVDIDTQVAQVTYGSWNRKTLTGRLSDKIDAVSVSGGGGTTNSGSAGSDRGGTLTQDGLETMMQTVKKTKLKQKLDILGNKTTAIEEQSDRQFLIWFGHGAPLPNEETPNGTARYPNSDWTTADDKALHVGDIYFDTDMAPASEGGRAWRWEAVEGSGTVSYQWKVATDLDTNTALEKIRDVASDGVLSAGTEKAMILTDWLTAKAQYLKYVAMAGQYSISDDMYNNAFRHLCDLLDGNSGDFYQPFDITQGSAPVGGSGPVLSPMYDIRVLAESDIYIPLFIRSADDDDGLLEEDTKLSDYDITAGAYRAVWDGYYEELTNIINAINAAVKTASDNALGQLSDMASDSKLDPAEKQTVKREFLAAWKERDKAGGILDMAYSGSSALVSETDYINPYNTAFIEVGSYLNGRANGNPVSWTGTNNFTIGDSTTDAAIDAHMPAWLQDANMDDTETIDGSTWRNRWAAFYSARTALLNALTENARTVAVLAGTLAASKVRCFVSASLPSTPYDAGDLWFKLEQAGSTEYELYTCTTGRQSGTGTMGDWKLLSNPLASVTNLLAELAELWEAPLSEYFPTYGNKARVYLDEDSAPANPIPSGEENNQDLYMLLHYNTGTSAYELQMYNNWQGWVDFGTGLNALIPETISSVLKSSASIAKLCQIKDMGIHTFTIWETMSNSANVYDIYFHRSTFADKFTGGTVDGGLGVWVRGRSGWEHVRDNTTGILENYADHIIAAVFGDDVYDQQTGQVKTPGDYFGNQQITSYASGLTIAKNFAEMFAKASDPITGDMKAKAGIVVRVENNQGYVDVTGTFTSADGYVRIQEYEEFFNTLVKSTALMIGDPSGFVPVSGETQQQALDRQQAAIDDQEVIIRRVSLTNNSVASRFGQAIFEEFVNDVLTEETIITGSHVTTKRYDIRAIRSSDGEWVNFTGEGTVDSPVTFDTADGKRVTVVGGIITNITNIP